nr:hypothetical protein [Mycoplasmopsis bovis]
MPLSLTLESIYIHAVSAFSIVFPNDTIKQLFLSAKSTSLSDSPPSGPTIKMLLVSILSIWLSNSLFSYAT